MHGVKPQLSAQTGSLPSAIGAPAVTGGTRLHLQAVSKLICKAQLPTACIAHSSGSATWCWVQNKQKAREDLENICQEWLK